MKIHATYCFSKTIYKRSLSLKLIDSSSLPNNNNTHNNNNSVT